MSSSTHDRRTFLKSGGLVAAGFAAGSLCMWKPNSGPSAAKAEQPTRFDLSKGTPSMSELAKCHFDACLGQDFTIDCEGEKLIGRLSSVEGKVTERVESFSIVFEIPGTQVMPQKMRKVSHSKLGTHEMFLVPIGNDGKATRYEAIFTRLLNKGGADV